MFIYSVTSSVSGLVIRSISRRHLLNVCAKHPEEDFSTPELIWTKEGVSNKRRRLRLKAIRQCLR